MADLKREMDAETAGAAKVLILDQIRLLEALLGEVEKIKVGEPVGETDFTLGLLNLGPMTVSIPPLILESGGRVREISREAFQGLSDEQKNMVLAFTHWETPHGGMKPEDFISPEGSGDVRIEFFPRIVGGVQHIAARLIRPRELPEPPHWPSTEEFLLPIETRTINNVQHRVAKFAMTAFYKGGTAEHSTRPSSTLLSGRGGYIAGTEMSGSRLGRVAGTPLALAGTRWSERWDMTHGGNVTRKGAPESPQLSAAINTGRRMLHDYGEAEYERLFLHPTRGLTVRYQTRANNLRQFEQQYRTAQRTMRQLVRQATGRGGGLFGSGMLAAGPMKLLGMAERVLEGAEGGGLSPVQMDTLNQVRDTMKRYFDERDKYEQEFERDLETASATLRDYLKEKARVVTVRIARQYKFPLHSDIQEQLAAELDDYAKDYAEELITRGNTAMQSFLRALRIIGRGGQTFREVWMDFLQNLWGVVAGPWVIGSGMVVLQWMMISFYINSKVFGSALGGQFGPFFYLWLAPVIMGGIFLVLNFEDTKYPLDALTHIIAGAITAYGTYIFLASIMTPEWMFESTGRGFLTFLIWGALCFFLGAMQFYPSGKFTFIFQMGAVMLIFGYVALGPYSAHFTQAIDQVKRPLIVVVNAVGKTIQEVWLITTNPTEYAKIQAAKNVKPETALDFPKGIEIKNFELFPRTVAASKRDASGVVPSYFAAAVVVKNDGKYTATDVKVNLYCDRSPRGYCCPPDSQDDSCKNPNFEPPDATTLRTLLKPGEAQALQFKNIMAWAPQQAHEAEASNARIVFNVTYAYATSSTLKTTIMHQDEIIRRQQEGEDVFRPVVATGSPTPGEISINVGPQPLYAGRQRNFLLFAVNNKRDDGAVRLKQGDNLFIYMPTSIAVPPSSPGGTGSFRCDDSFVSYEGFDQQPDTIKHKFKVKKDIDIESGFNVVFAFLCTFDAAQVTIAGTDFIRAELPKYEFTVKYTKNFIVTTPLGIPGSGGGVVPPGGGASTVATGCTGSVQAWESTYNANAGQIDAAVADANAQALQALATRSENPQALIAAIISQESGWNADALSTCGAAGMMQLMPASAIARGLKVPSYATQTVAGSCPGTSNVVPVCSRNPGAGLSIANCDKPNDERFDPAKNLRGGAVHISGNLASCGGNIEQALTQYYQGGGCTINTVYTVPVMNYYNQWKQCIKAAVTTSSGVANPVQGVNCPVSDYTSPRGPEGVCDGTYTAAGNTCAGSWIHGSIDILAARGTDVRAAHDGTISSVATSGPGGNATVIQHTGTVSATDPYAAGWYSYYSHLDTIESGIATGAPVTKGQKIGTVGCSGCPSTTTPNHLHFTLYKGGTTADYRQDCKHVDPCFVCGCGTPARTAATC